MQGKISSIFADDAPMGDRGMRRRIFTCGFPPRVKDYGPSHYLSDIPTAGGGASAAAAKPRIAAARGVAIRDFKGSPRGYEYEYGLPCAWVS